MRTCCQKGGFTLIELLVAITLVAILAFFSFTSFQKQKQKAKLARVSTELFNIAKSVNQYYEDNAYQYPPDVVRGVPPGLEKYLAGGVWPKSVWAHGVYDWDNWVHPCPGDYLGQKIQQITYRLCDVGDPVSYCSDPLIFPNFTRYSAIYYCINGPCIPHCSFPHDPAYCVNCKVKEQNPPL